MCGRTEIRAFKFNQMQDSSSLAAVLLEADGTRILCKVKAEISKDPLLSSRRNAKVRVSLSGDDTADLQMTNRIENVLSQLIPADALEKIQLGVYFEVLAVDGSLVDFCLNLALYTMMLGNVPVKDTVASCTCILSKDDQLLIDPTSDELKEAKGRVRLIVSSQKEKLVDFEVVGLINGEPDILRQCTVLSMSAAKALANNILQRVITQTE